MENMVGPQNVQGKGVQTEGKRVGQIGEALRFSGRWNPLAVRCVRLQNGARGMDPVVRGTYGFPGVGAGINRPVA